MDSHDFLEVAEEWSLGTREAEWRSAVSRAYYAAFHVARSLFLGWGFQVPRGDTAHAYLWLRLSGCVQLDVVEAGHQLNDLRGSRNRADYDLDRPFHQTTAHSFALLARKIMELLETLPGEPLIQTRIIEAIKTYERNVLREVTWHS